MRELGIMRDSSAKESGAYRNVTECSAVRTGRHRNCTGAGIRIPGTD